MKSGINIKQNFKKKMPAPNERLASADDSTTEQRN